MSLTKKVSEKVKAVEAALTAPKKSLPRRVIYFVLIEDQSGSMAAWRQPLGQFWPAVARNFVETGGKKVADLIYVLRVIVSGGVATSEIAPLADATDPLYTPDGETPLGAAFKVTAEKCDRWVRDVVLPNEVSVRNFEVLVVSDCHATGETTEETAAGVNALLAVLKKFNGKVTVVGPAKDAMNMDVATKLDVNGRGIKYLDADPKSVVTITFASLLAASRKLGGSNPLVRN